MINIVIRNLRDHVFNLILGKMPGHYCNYCCLKEFGDDFFEDKNKCLKTCLEVILF